MKKNRLVVLFISVWIILAAIFGIYDLAISKQIVNQNSNWAKFLQDYGMVPGLLIILSGIYLHYSFIKLKSGLWSYVQRVVFFLTNSGLIFYLFEIIFGDYATDNLIVFLIISFAINLVVFIALHKLKPITNLVAIQYSKIVVLVSLFGYVICVQGVKYFWGRVRFRELDAAFSQFSPWYLPQGITGFDSFPSGHAAMGWMLLPLIILLSNKRDWIRYSSLILIFIWAVVLAFSRVVIGAHYSSDVLFGSFFVIIIYHLFYSK